MVKSISAANILISRTDSIGDVVLTLPMAGVLKSIMPGAHILFLAKNYTKDVVNLSEYVDEFVSYEELMALEPKQRIDYIRNLNIDVVINVLPRKELAWLFMKAGILLRIGTTNRLFHWFTCNKLVVLSRRNSHYHEAQLNLKLLVCLGAKKLYDFRETIPFFGLTKHTAPDLEFAALIDHSRENIILHPKSKGSAKEWGMDNFDALIKKLPAEKYKLFISGTEEEAFFIKNLIKNNPEVVDITGKMNLHQFISFIYACDGLIAASTGPLHIAAALGKKAIGLFSPRRPIHPGRWMPLGKRAAYIVYDDNCRKCLRGKDCNCIQQITADQVLELFRNI